MERGRGGTDSMAQLSSWTDAMSKGGNASNNHSKGSTSSKQQPTSLPAKPFLRPAVEEEEPDYEEEFEDYEEEFEEVEKPFVAPPKSVAPGISSSKETSYLGAKTVSKQEKSTVPSAPSSSAPLSLKFDSGVGNSLARSIADPRTIRIQRILQSGVLRLSLEKFTILNILPTSPYDYYLSEIRKPNSTVKQTGIPSDIEYRELEVATDEVETKNKESQFCYEDDTAFFNAISQIKDKKMNSQKKRRNNGTEDNVNSQMTEIQSQQSSLKEKEKEKELEEEKQEEVDVDISIGASSVSVFLDKASVICETILRESRKTSLSSAAAAASSSSSFKNILNNSGWISYGVDSSNGPSELIRYRDCVDVQLSLSSPLRILFTHPFPEDPERQINDLKPMKVSCCLFVFLLFFLFLFLFPLYSLLFLWFFYFLLLILSWI
jgi:hypothetical protein